VATSLYPNTFFFISREGTDVRPLPKTLIARPSDQHSTILLSMNTIIFFVLRIHVYIYAYTYEYSYLHIYTHAYTYIYKHMPVYIYTFSHIHVHIY